MPGWACDGARGRAGPDDWPVPTAAAAVVGPAGVLATHGPIEHAFALASVTKPLAALAVLVAVEEEAVSLDDPADDACSPAPRCGTCSPTPPGWRRSGRCARSRRRTRRVYSNVGIELAASLVVERAPACRSPQYFDEALSRRCS